MTFENKFIDNQMDSDLNLLQRIKLNDRYAFELIYNKYCELLFEHAYRVLRERDICMDIVQEIFLWFWTNREYLEIKSLKPYFLAAVKFQVANYIRKNKIQERYILDFQKIHGATAAVHEFHEVKELKDLMQHLTDLLPDRCREVFVLSRYKYLSNKEIAAKLGISEKTVEMHITLALKRFRVGMRDYLNVLLLFF
ncbi:RNA polymerase sigma factor [Sphingobacterium rhinopitheci]|mgnify:CR=1 FL=1|uniref:RNA polymerase sigma factor n=1 Tax=Sphingobacterium rhinopitheci TaxID=2781960 RepID=UPI001F52A2EF|nr:RNA polymerase sigma-70 factor [Sphingobacterium rhinopitheci]MCI0922670.1 RNA polymerase sigma-70 factor [Sphingobacterium rhinopitheci]